MNRWTASQAPTHPCPRCGTITHGSERTPLCVTCEWRLNEPTGWHKIVAWIVLAAPIVAGIIIIGMAVLGELPK